MKGERVAQLELILRAHPEGLRRADIARRLGVHRSTISRYVEDLASYIDVFEENNLIKIKQKEQDENIALSVYESIAFNIGAELLASNAEVQNPHLASGLRKIAMNMRSYAPKISDNMLNVAEKIDLEVQKNKIISNKYNNILEVLIDAWVSGRIVRLTLLDTEEVELSPYFIGFSEEDHGRIPITVTGRLRHTKEITTLDISAITAAILLDETFTIPDNLKPFKKKRKDKASEAIDMIPLKLQIQEKSAMNAFIGIVHKDIKYFKDESGVKFCTLKAENSIDLMMRIFQCGASVKIVEPEKYKNKYLKYMNKIMDIYKKEN